MTDSNRRIEQATEALRAFGYVVLSEPLEGSENVYADDLWSAVRKVEDRVAFNAKRHGFRGMSKSALAALHSDIPEPTWGVEVASAQPIRRPAIWLP